MSQEDKLKKTFFPSFHSSPFGMIAKPGGSICNLACDYCYYLEKKELYPSHTHKMSDEVLEAFISQYISSQPTQTVSFVWQGGEPCLLGLDFFRRVIVFQQKYARGKIIENSLQTNGTLLNDEWCAFLKKHNFLTGISIDGPAEYHNRFRKNRAGKPTFREVIRGVELLKKHEAEFNTLTTVNSHNVNHPLEVYHFLKSIGSHFMQFLPVVERVSVEKQDSGLALVPNKYKEEAEVTDFSVDPLKFGKFMTSIFDEWVRYDVGYYFIQLFDTTLANWVGEQPGVCMYAASCGHAGTIEFNGDVYSCDHFVFPDYYLGNILETSLASLMNSTKQQVFGQQKFSDLPKTCLRCRHYNRCYGECPKKRFMTTKEGEYGLNYLCEGYQHFFDHVTPYMEYMSKELKNERSPANVMHYLRQT